MLYNNGTLSYVEEIQRNWFQIENYYPFYEGIIQRGAHIQRDHENLMCSFQFPCFVTRNVFKESGRMGCKFTCRDNIS